MSAGNLKITHVLKDHHRKLIYLLVLFYSVGVAGLSLDQTRPVFEMLIPWTLLGSFLLLVWMDEDMNRRKIMAAVVLYLLSFMIEAVGVNTGHLFGEYTYGDTLGPKLFETPLIIGVNWLILLYCTWELTGRWNLKGAFRILAGAGIMVLYDVILEPSAISHNMWQWPAGYVPLQNYLAWFLYSALALFIIRSFNISLKNKIAPALLMIQMIFFFTLNIIRYLWG